VIAEVCGTYGERRGAYRGFLGITEGKKPGHRWEDNIEIGF
jgi:hypothetical protein